MKWEKCMNLFFEYTEKEFNEKKENPATKEQIDEMEKQANKLNINVAASYKEFLTMVDGFDDLGYLIYASQTRRSNQEGATVLGFIEANEIYRKSWANRVFYGEHGDDMLVYDEETKKYWIQMRVPGDFIESFESLDDLFSAVFTQEAEDIMEELGIKE